MLPSCCMFAGGRRELNAPRRTAFTRLGPDNFSISGVGSVSPSALAPRPVPGCRSDLRGADVQHSRHAVLVRGHPADNAIVLAGSRLRFLPGFSISHRLMQALDLVSLRWQQGLMVAHNPQLFSAVESSRPQKDGVASIRSGMTIDGPTQGGQHERNVGHPAARGSCEQLGLSLLVRGWLDAGRCELISGDDDSQRQRCPVHEFGRALPFVKRPVTSRNEWRSSGVRKAMSPPA